MQSKQHLDLGCSRGVRRVLATLTEDFHNCRPATIYRHLGPGGELFSHWHAKINEFHFDAKNRSAKYQIWYFYCNLETVLKPIFI